MLHITSDKSALDLALIHDFLSQHSSWAQGIPRALVERAIANSLCFGGFVGTSQVAFARVVTDQATFAYLADVFVLPEHRGRGHGRLIVAAALAHPGVQGLRRFVLATSSAHGLYAQFGFKALQRPDTMMEKYAPTIYQDSRWT